MYQVQMAEYGAPAVLHLVEVPDAEPGPGQVAIRTAAAGITFVETQMRAGQPP
jgi:NADPH2:quinone reductase